MYKRVQNCKRKRPGIKVSDCIHTRRWYCGQSTEQPQKAWERHSVKHWRNRNRWIVLGSFARRISKPGQSEGDISKSRKKKFLCRHTTLPARPPAINANPIKRNNRALHTALESPNPSSPLTLSLSMRFMTKYPSKEQMPGIQSTKVTWTGASVSGADPHGDLACADRIAASKNVQFARANYMKKDKYQVLVVHVEIVLNCDSIPRPLLGKLPQPGGVFPVKFQGMGSSIPV